RQHPRELYRDPDQVRVLLSVAANLHAFAAFDPAASLEVAPAEKLIRPGGGWCTGGVERGRLGGCPGHLVSAPAG
ncbi:hypothetical protein ACWEKM_46380, partial [Streptomyces sp. NPDC004752]